MAARTVDTLRFVRRLKDAGVQEKQAEAKAEALAEVFSELSETRFVMRSDAIRTEGELKLIKWMLGLVAVGIILLNYSIFL